MAYKIKIEQILQNALSSIYYACILFGLSAFCPTFTNAQNSIRLKGHVLEKDSISPVPFAFVVNKKTGKGNPCDGFGYFEITSDFTDTLLVSTINKIPRKIAVKDLAEENNKPGGLKIILYNKTFELKEVVVKSFDFTPEEKNYYKKFIYKPKNYSAVNSPITALYDSFSKEARQRRMLQAIYEKNLIEEIAKNRLPDDLIVRLTGNPKMTFEHFRTMCHISDYYIATALEYDLYTTVRNCYKNYYNGQ